MTHLTCYKGGYYGSANYRICDNNADRINNRFDHVSVEQMMIFITNVSNPNYPFNYKLVCQKCWQALICNAKIGMRKFKE